MTRALVGFALVLVFFSAQGRGPDDVYLQIYNSLQQADLLNQNGNFKAAAEKYREAQLALEKFSTAHPNWNPQIIRYRRNYVTERVEALSRFLSPKEIQTAEVETAPKSANRSELDAQIQALAQEVRRLESEKAGLEAKLREALSVQPAQTDPRQLERAEERIATLEKERDLLKVALEQIKTGVVEASPDRSSGRVRQLEEERDDLQKKLDLVTKHQAAQEARYKAELKLAEDKLKKLENFSAERDELQRKLAETLAAADGEKPSRGDLRKIKKLEEDKADIEKKFEKTSRELAALQTDREKRIRDYQSAMDRIKELERERDGLEKRLQAAQAFNPSEREDLIKQNQQLRSRLEAYEARPTPFTPEELALFKKPETPSVPRSFVISSKMTKDLPGKSKTLLSEADKAFAAQRFEEAEEKYEQVLDQNSTNVYALANLASAQLERNRLQEADETLGRALAASPDDAFSLLLLGKLKMSQNKFDEALDALARSAQVNPQSAETHNYLGIVLSEKGQRVSAEAALRKAIQIQPDYASAHHNLSIIYATQRPPFMELARWHYQKAVSLGHAKNPKLENLMAEH